MIDHRLMQRQHFMARVPTGYDQIATALDDIPFRSSIEMDQNRVEDAVFMREVYLDSIGHRDERFIAAPVSTLEVLMALCERGSVVAEGDLEPEDLFRIMMQNSGLSEYRGLYLDRDDIAEIHDIVDRILDRKIDYDGVGGWFPLTNAEWDQRKEELWYQMMTYLVQEGESVGLLQNNGDQSREEE